MWEPAAVTVRTWTTPVTGEWRTEEHHFTGVLVSSENHCGHNILKVSILNFSQILPLTRI